MRTTYLQTSILVLALLITGFFANVNGQEQDRRFSISLNGGITLSSFTNSEGYNPALGLGLQYTLTPTLSLEGQGYYHEMRNNDKMLAGSVRAIFHLQNVLGTTTISNRLAPHALIGLGLISHSPSEFEGIRPMLVLGSGMAFRATNSLDIFGQVEYNLVHDLPNTATLSGIIQNYGVLSLGLRYHFGDSDAEPMMWRRPTVGLTDSDLRQLRRVSRTERVDVEVDDLDPELTDLGPVTAAIVRLSNRVDRLEREANQNTAAVQGMDGRVSALESRVDGHEGRISDLERKYADLHTKVRDLEEQMAKRPAKTDEYGLTQELPDGYYVQVYAAYNMSDAQRVARNVGQMVDSPVLITKRHKVYEVRIGTYERFPAAANTLRAVSGTYTDAFVVKFPRPSHLRDDYSGIKRVD
jgi:hypothetical protein